VTAAPQVNARIPVGVEVESRPSPSRWVDRTWRAVGIRPGSRAIPDWTVLSESDEAVRYYAGTTLLVLRASETGRYRDNLTARTPSVYVVLRRAAASPAGWTLHLASVDPSEAQAHAEVGDDHVDALPMPPGLSDWIAAFVDRHHVDRPSWKRKRDAKSPTAEARPPAPSSEADAFLDRWSRRKRAAERQGPRGAPSPEPAPPPAASSVAVPAPPEDSAAILSALKTRGDYAALVRSQAPAALTAAALRHAWRSDPAIAGHRPLVDYDWNVNAPGYGIPLPADDPGRLLAALFGHLRNSNGGRGAPGEDCCRPDADPASDAEPSAEPNEQSDVPRPEPVASAPVARGGLAASPARRRHGGAAPA
jgi:hypothetical protein